MTLRERIWHNTGISKQLKEGLYKILKSLNHIKRKSTLLIFHKHFEFITNKNPNLYNRIFLLFRSIGEFADIIPCIGKIMV